MHVLVPGAALVGPADVSAQPAGSARIEVESQRSVTVVGSSESLRSVIQELCESSGVELKQYRAPDRPVSARYEEAPLRHVIERLLRDESFMLGFQPGSDGGDPEIAWLSVIGTDGGRGGAQAGAGAGGPGQSGSDDLLPLAAMANANAASRIASAKAFARRIDSEEALRARFLKASVTDLAAEMKGMKHARAFLQTARSAVRNPQARAKINTLLSRVR